MDDDYLRERIIIASESVKNTILYKNIAILLNKKNYTYLFIIFYRYFNR